MRTAATFRGDLASRDVNEWFAKHGHNMIVVHDSGTYAGRNIYVGENENVFLSRDGKEKLTAEVSYHEGCPTCGGAYVRRWTWQRFT